MKVKKYFYFSFIFLASLRILSQVTSIESLDGIGFMTGFSPLPIVFSDKSGYEDFTTRINISFPQKNGKTIEQKLDYKIISKLDGPLYRIGILGVSLGYAYRFPEEFWLKNWKYMFCESGIGQKIIPNFNNQKEFSITLKVLKNSKWILFKKGILCQ